MTAWLNPVAYGTRLVVLCNGTERAVMDFDEMKGAMSRAIEDDIVTRLRNSCVPDDSKWLDSMPTDRLMLEAADEIERLWADRDICLRAAENSKQFADQAADEIERLRTQVRELQSELHRLEKIANYG